MTLIKAGYDTPLMQAPGHHPSHAGHTSPSIENADPSIPPIVDFIPPECGVAVRLDPDPRHGVVEDLVILNEPQAWR